MLYVIVVSVTKCNIPAFNGQRVYSEWLIRCACIWQYLCCIFSVAKLYCGLVQPIGLVDYLFLKESIWRFLLFSRRCLKQLSDDTLMSSSVKLFHRFMTRWEKNCSRVLQWQWFFTSFQLWPLVILSSALWKKTDLGVAVIPFTILKISSKSALFQRSSEDHNLNWWSLSSYGKPVRCGNRRVNRCWTFSNNDLSLLKWGCQTVEQLRSY